MFAVSFDNGAFNVPEGENCIILVIDSKSKYDSMDEFLDKAFEFMNTDGEFADKWEEYYRDRVYTTVSDSDKEFMKNRIDEMNQKVAILHEPVISAVYIVPPKWNDITLGIETESDYVFYVWTTSA